MTHVRPPPHRNLQVKTSLTAPNMSLLLNLSPFQCFAVEICCRMDAPPLPAGLKSCKLIDKITPTTMRGTAQVVGQVQPRGVIGWVTAHCVAPLVSWKTCGQSDVEVREDCCNKSVHPHHPLPCPPVKSMNGKLGFLKGHSAREIYCWILNATRETRQE